MELPEKVILCLRERPGYTPHIPGVIARCAVCWHRVHLTHGSKAAADRLGAVPLCAHCVLAHTEEIEEGMKNQLLEMPPEIIADIVKAVGVEAKELWKKLQTKEN